MGVLYKILLLRTYQYLCGASIKDTSSLIARVMRAKPFIFGAITILSLATLGLVIDKMLRGK